MTQVSQQLRSLYSNLYPECFGTPAPLCHPGFISFKQIQNIPEHDRGQILKMAITAVRRKPIPSTNVQSEFSDPITGESTIEYHLSSKGYSV